MHHSDGDYSLLFSECFGGVGDQVQDDLPELCGVSSDCGEFLGESDVQCGALWKLKPSGTQAFRGAARKDLPAQHRIFPSGIIIIGHILAARLQHSD
jgi:hypothetical protein